jgi:DNA-binding LacI/PurR family transcriptional regulator
VKKKRMTIGISIDDISMVGGLKALRSITALAKERGVDAYFFHFDLRTGAEFLPPAWSALGESVDGIVAYQAWRDESVYKSFRRFFPAVPIVNSTRIYPGCPGTPADSYGGMREIVRHLLERHEYRRIGYIRGPAGNWAALERYRAYVDELAAHGLKQDPDLVSPYVGWDGGDKAVRVFMDDRKLAPGKGFDALVGSNDSLALGAMAALRERGVRIPMDVAIAGFDDDIRASFSTPALTTSEYNMGLHSARSLLSMLAGETVPEKAFAPAALIVRRSCGCQYEAVAQAAVGASIPPSIPPQKTMALAEFLRGQRGRVVSEMIESVRNHPAGKQALAEWMEQLFDDMSAAFSAGDKRAGSDFLTTLELQLDKDEVFGSETASWQGPISILRRNFLPYLSGLELSRAELVWQEARALINEISLRERASIEHKANNRISELRAIESELLTTHNVSDLMDKLSLTLPRLGIPACYFVLYGVDGKSRLMMSYGGAAKPAADHAAFPAGLLLPEGSLPDRQMSLIIEPLAFRERQLGFIAFELGPLEGAIYDSLRVTISSALEGALLLEQVQAHSDQLGNIVSQTLSTSEEMQAAISETARQAQLVSRSAKESMDVSKAGRDAVSDSVEGMKRVQQEVQDIAKRIQALETRTRQIGEIMGALEDIGAQSDILAINANIQAARAGNTGLGFAVVAREMRQLTEKSREANQKIGLILGDIQKAAEEAAAATKKGSAEASLGMDLAGRAGQTISNLSASIEEAAHVALQISASTDQQTRAMEQLVREVQAIKDASSKTSGSFKDAGL